MAADETGARRAHPATIAIRTARNLPVAAVAWLLIRGDQPPGSTPWFIWGLAATAVVVVAVSALAWHRTRYFFDADGDFRLDSGVLYQRQRTVALSRLQSVDVVRPFVARLFGMASVRVEVAGAGDSHAVVEFLTVEQAAALRGEVLARAAGERPDAPTAPEEAMARVATGDLVVSLLLRGGSAAALIITVLAVTGTLVMSGFGGLLLAGFGVFAPAATIVVEFNAFHGFTLARSPDGLRIRSGLFSTTARTVPVGRIHAIELQQPFLWRRRDWVRVAITIAGSGPADGDSGAVPKVLLPVAQRADAIRLIEEVLPSWRLAEAVLDPAPPAARRRAWLQHGNLGAVLGPVVLVTTRGRVVRRTAAVPHARIQSVRVIQGPWQRSLGLATLRADTVPGPVRVLALHRDAASVRALADREAALMKQAGADAPPGPGPAPAAPIGADA